MSVQPVERVLPHAELQVWVSGHPSGGGSFKFPHGQDDLGQVPFTAC
jgi:hypothetical protein